MARPCNASKRAQPTKLKKGEQSHVHHVCYITSHRMLRHGGDHACACGHTWPWTDR